MQTLTPKRILLDSIASLLFGLGILGITSSFWLWWFIHGDYDRYIWIIHGPSPFSNFGSGPFQGGMYILLLLCGGIFVTISLLLKGFIWKDLFSSSNTYFKVVRWLISFAALGILGLFLLLWMTTPKQQVNQLSPMTPQVRQ
jgi:hypothetical protein